MKKSLLRPLVVALLPVFTGASHAATYYVDNMNGKDSYTGQSSAIAGDSGPWMSIERVNATNLQPGDTVLLKCGQTWRTALTPKSSGASGQPIRFGSYPSSTCTNKPLITGAVEVADHNWIATTDGAWSTTLPLDRIRNGGLMQNSLGWSIWSGDGSGRLHTPSKTCVGTTTSCLAIISGTASSLTSSTTFPIDGGKTYKVSFMARLEPGQTARAIIRRGSGNYGTLGLVSPLIVGDGQWKRHEFTFVASNSHPSARLDFEVPQNQIVYVKEVSLKATTTPSPSMIADDQAPMEPAHHPNRGYDSANPTSVFLATISASPTVTAANGAQVSNMIKVNPDLALPTGGKLVPGLGVSVRNNMWALSEHKIKSISSDGKEIYFDSETRYPLQFGKLGYFFTGARWMLDSDGEWFYDPTGTTLTVRMRDGKHPGNRVSFSDLPVGIDLTKLNYVEVDNLAVNLAQIGVKMEQADHVTLSNLSISRIQDTAVAANYATYGTMAGLDIQQVGLGAINGYDTDYMQLSNSRFDQIGLYRVTGTARGLPRSTPMAVGFNNHATVTGNRFSWTGYGAVNVGTNSRVADNSVADFCLTLSDCGALMLDKGGAGTTIQSNLVQRGVGNIDGLPSWLFYSHAVGIYADNHAHDVSILDNAVSDSDYAIQIHDGFRIDVERNTAFGARRYLMWIQETTKQFRDTGDIYDVSVYDNKFFPTVPSAIVRQGSVVNDDTSDMTRFDGNVYSTLFTPKAVSDYTSSYDYRYTLPEWQAAKTINGVPRNQDASASVASPLPGYATGRILASILPNANFSNNAQGWSKWSSSSSGTATTAVENCGSVASACLKLTATGANGNYSSPNFSVSKARYYKYTFDARASKDGITLTTLLRHAGTASYATLQGDSSKHALGTGWKRYSVTFLASEDAIPDTATKDNGARLDFTDLPADTSAWIANVEINPVDPNGLIERKATMLGNHGASRNSFDCPDRGTALESQCGIYLEFPSGAQISWPVSLEPRESKIVFTQNTSQPDGDGDGVPDSQDACSSTPAGRTVNSRGCEFGQ